MHTNPKINYENPTKIKGTQMRKKSKATIKATALLIRLSNQVSNIQSASHKNG